MIELKTDNLLLENAEAMVNTVNCVGVMGKGIALQFKRAYPENFREYEKACKTGEVKPTQGFEVGANDFIRKPIDTDKLLQKVSDLLQLR